MSVVESEALLVVFFEGTANSLEPITTQIGEFAKATQAIDLGAPGIDVGASSDQNMFKIAFDGCGVTDGLSGTLFAFGLDGQCREVATWILKILASKPGRKVKCVAVGLSRGGIACMKLARLLSRKDFLRDCSVHLLLFDPVPGTTLSTGFPFTAREASDLSGCLNLKSVLALYPHQPLPDISLRGSSISPGWYLGPTDKFGGGLWYKRKSEVNDFFLRGKYRIDKGGC
jgi:hypothetical protein